MSRRNKSEAKDAYFDWLCHGVSISEVTRMQHESSIIKRYKSYLPSTFHAFISELNNVRAFDVILDRSDHLLSIYENPRAGYTKFLCSIWCLISP